MQEGLIIKALSGFYDVKCGENTIRCRARGKFRLDGTSPLVGDHVVLEMTGNSNGYIQSIVPRRNFFIRPAVANIDYLIILVANVNPVTDPFLADRVLAIAAHAGCEAIVCINKCDLDRGDELFNIYTRAGFRTLRTSAVTGEGIEELRKILNRKVSAFTGNSGVGKSSVLNALHPEFHAEVGEVSEKLGRGRHTTRHVELFELESETFLADTPGFASFDLSQMAPIRKDELQFDFQEFRQYIGKCRFDDCAHLKEPGCAVLAAVEQGKICPSRHASYVRLYNISAQFKTWEQK